MREIANCRNVSKFYQQGSQTISAVSDASLDVNEGDFICLSGPSGSGKTTLLNLFGGLDKPSQGEITVSGHRIDLMSQSELAEFRLRNLGLIFQAYNLIPVLSALENTEYVMRLQGVDKKQCATSARAMLIEVGLEGMENRRPSELSGGQQQRVAVARAIVSMPKIVLADEPTANLDSQTAEQLIKLMRNLNIKHGITFIISTHDQMVLNHASLIVQIHDGKIKLVKQKVTALQENIA
jgi:putative ABC transport system ATP-binding protein